MPKRDKRTAREQVERRQQAARLLIEEIFQRNRIDARYRNIGTTAIDDQRANEKQEANLQFAQFARLLRDICRILLGLLSHVLPVLRLSR